MKKIILAILLLTIFNQGFALNATEILNKVPENFKWECYEYYSKISNSLFTNKTTKIQINKNENLVIKQWDFLLPYKYYSHKNDNIYLVAFYAY